MLSVLSFHEILLSSVCTFLEHTFCLILVKHSVSNIIYRSYCIHDLVLHAFTADFKMADSDDAMSISDGECTETNNTDLDTSACKLCNMTFNSAQVITFAPYCYFDDCMLC